jgi:hypothetical protein
MSTSKVILLYQSTSHWEASQSMQNWEKAEISNQHATKTGLDILAYRPIFLQLKNFIKSSHNPRGDWAGECESN